MADCLVSDSNATFTKQMATQWFKENYPKIKPGTVSAHLTKMSVNAKSRIHHNIRPGEDDLFFQIDRNRYRLYKPDSDPPPIYSESNTTTNLVEASEEEAYESPGQVSDSEFAFEADLRNYLSKNLQLVESGLRLYEEEGISGIEFPVGGRLIDLLAVDSNGNFLVIELKVSKGYDRVIGQLMRYVAWIKENLATEEQSVRGAIIARSISDDLKLACSLSPWIELFEYQLSLSLTKI